MTDNRARPMSFEDFSESERELAVNVSKMVREVMAVVTRPVIVLPDNTQWEVIDCRKPKAREHYFHRNAVWQSDFDGTLERHIVKPFTTPTHKTGETE